MFAEELLESRPPDSLDLLQCRPPQEEVADQVSADIREPFQYLRKTELQERRHPIAGTCQVGDNSSAVLDQVLQGAGLLVIREPGFESITMMDQQLNSIF